MVVVAYPVRADGLPGELVVDDHLECVWALVIVRLVSGVKCRLFVLLSQMADWCSKELSELRADTERVGGGGVRMRRCDLDLPTHMPPLNSHRIS